MPLSPGDRLGPYEITAAIGAGGMGEVYRAHDARLERDVAIKVANEAFTERFTREARAIAALNHTNVCHLYDVGPNYLVMEYVDGETLQGPVDFDEALPIIRQLIDGIEAAHEKHIVHRDLKPANIKITPEGVVKILDFGLARALEPERADDLANSPTIAPSIGATRAGMIVGTSAYMAPEQAKGRPADQRADIWGFGVVVYELLTGKKPFAGDSTVEILGAVLNQEPDIAAAPPRVRRLLSWCLEKDRKQRLQAIGDARRLLAEAPAAAVAHVIVKKRPIWRRLAPVVVTGIVAAIAAGLAGWNLKPAPAAPITKFAIVLPDDRPFVRSSTNAGARLVAISPDGTQVAYFAGNRLYVHLLGSMEDRPLTDQGSGAWPVFAPDGQWLAFFSSASELAVKKIAVTGGAPVDLVHISEVEGIRPMSWSVDRLLFGADKGIMQVSANGGGKPDVLVPVQPPEAVTSPQLLGDGRLVLYVSTTASGDERWEQGDVVVYSLATRQRTVVYRGASSARYLPTGHLVFLRGGTLHAVTFDLGALEVRGGPMPLVAGILRPSLGTLGASRSSRGAENWSISDTGTLAYIPGSTGDGDLRQVSFALVDRKGKMQPLGLPPGAYSHPRISPDGRQLAYALTTPRDSSIHVYDLNGGSPPRRLTFGGNAGSPVWTADGTRIAFLMEQSSDSGLFWQMADGSGKAERLLKGEGVTLPRPEAWVDGKLAFLGNSNAGSGDILTLKPGGAEGPQPLVTFPGNQRYSEFSRDGRWLAYSSSEAGNAFDIFVQPYPPTGPKFQVTTKSARTPLWSKDGRQLYYIEPATDGHIVIADVHTTPSFSVGASATIAVPGAQFVGDGRQYDVMPDGRFLVLIAETAAKDPVKPPPSQINVVLNFFEELKQKVPGK